MADDAANFRRIPLEICNEGRMDLIDEPVAEDYVEHIPTPPGVPPTREGLRMFVEASPGGVP